MTGTAGKSLRTVALAATLAVTGLSAAMMMTPTPAVAQQDEDGPAGEVDMETFYRELAPHGRWFDHPRYGNVWSPSVEEGWKPYSRGHWANTEEHGWYWVAEEEWGWAPFHYGRWAYEDDDGWFWVPGTTWGPAWVSWRSNDDYVGWAPLPPDADWEPDGNLRFYDNNYDDPRSAFIWSFVQPRYMFEPGLHWRLASRSRAASIIRETRPAHRYSFVNRRIFNHGIDYRRIERQAGRSVPIVKLRFSSQARDHGWRAMNDRGVVPVYRPRIVSRQDSTPPQYRPRDSSPFGGRPNGWFGGDRRDQPRSPSAEPARQPWFGRGRDNDNRPAPYEVRPREAAPIIVPSTPSGRGGDGRGFGGRGGDGRSGDRRGGDGRSQGGTPAAANPTPAQQPVTIPTQTPVARPSFGGGGSGGNKPAVTTAPTPAPQPAATTPTTPPPKEGRGGGQGDGKGRGDRRRDDSRSDRQ